MLFVGFGNGSDVGVTVSSFACKPCMMHLPSLFLLGIFDDGANNCHSLIKIFCRLN